MSNRTKENQDRGVARMNAHECIGEIELCASAVRELSQRVIELSNSPEYYEQFNATNYALVATQDKLDSLVRELSVICEQYEKGLLQ